MTFNLPIAANSAFNRRTFIKGAAATAALLPLAMPAIAQSTRKVVRLADDAGANFEIRKQYFYDPFTAATGIEVEHYSGERSLAKLKAMADTGNLEFDMSVDEGSRAFAAGKAGFLDPLDLSQLDMSRLPFTEWTSEHTIAWQFYSLGIGYNTETQVGPVPSTWQELWDAETFPGRRGLLARPNDTLEAALLADGVKPSELYPLDIDRAYASLDKIKANINVWIDDMPKGIELLQARELQYCHSTTARLQNARRAGLPLDFISSLPISAPSNLQIMKDSPNYENAMQLVKWILNNEDGGSEGYFTHMVGFGPTDSAVTERLSAEVKANLASRDDAGAAWVNAQWWGDNLATVTERHQLWLIS